MAAFGGRITGGLSMSSLARHGLSTTSTSVRPLGFTPATQLRHRRNSPASSSVVPSTRRTFVNEAVTTVEQLLLAAQTNLHIPWYILIPGFGATISLIFRVPAAKYTQRLAQRRSLLKPVLMAWGRRHFQDVNIAKQADPVRNDWEPQVEIMKRMEKTSKRLLKEWGVQPWKQFVPFLAFPGWLVGIEALRRLCSGPVGLLGMFLGLGKDGKAAAEATSKAAEVAQGTTETVVSKAAETTQQAVSQVTEATTTAVANAAQTITEATTASATTPIADTINPLTDILPDSLSNYFQNPLPTSLEGCLWFPDLMAADPLHILPFVLSFTMFVNVMPRNREGWLRLLNPGTDELNPNNIGEHASKIKLQKSVGLRMQRALLLLTLIVGPATINLPAALHLYWITTSLTSNAITSVVAAKMPLPPYLGPAKGRGDDPYVRPKLPGLDWEPDPTIKKKAVLRPRSGDEV